MLDAGVLREAGRKKAAEWKERLNRGEKERSAGRVRNFYKERQGLRRMCGQDE